MYKLKIADYTFEFRDLTWLDEFNSSGHVEVLSRVTTAISKEGKQVTINQPGVLKALMSFPQDIRDRMWKMYMVSQPKARAWTIQGDYWIPPEPKPVEIQELEEVPEDEQY